MGYRNRLIYYRGDPGFFGSLKKIGSAVAKIGKGVGKFVPGISTAISAIELASGVGKGLAGGPLRNIGLPRGVTVMPGGGAMVPSAPVMAQIGGPVASRGVFSDVIGGGSTGAPRRRYRRMNVTNMRALKRSMRRVKGFAKMASDAISFTKRVRMKSPKRRSR